MSWHDVDAPDQVAAETGPNLATGDYAATNPDWTLADGVWSREGGGRLLLATDQWGEMAFTPDAHYEVRADVHGATAYKSLVNVDGGGGQATLPVEAPLPETLPGDGWVQVTQAGRAPTDPATGSFAIEATGPGLVQIRNPSVAVRTGRIILTVPGDVLAENIMASGGIIAGTPGGARVELNEEGLLAFDATNTETARINGEGGEFVGGEFRTSDALPGQVTLSDDAYVTHLDGGGVFPGLRITPSDTSGFNLPPAIGPGVHGLTIFGGRRTEGGSSVVQCNPDASFMRTFRDDNRTAGEIQTSATESFMRTFRDGGGMGGEIQASPTESFIRTFGADGVSRGGVETAPTYSQMTTRAEDGVARGVLYSDTSKVEMRVVKSDNYNSARITADGATITLFAEQNGQRYLKINETGIWIESGGKAYNLEQTASDSGWRGLSPEGGFTPIPEGCDVRLLGRMIHFRGAVTGNVTTSWQTIATVPADFRPQVRQINSGASSSLTNLMFQTHVDGRLQVKANNSATGVSIFVNTIFYPID